MGGLSSSVVYLMEEIFLLMQESESPRIKSTALRAGIDVALEKSRKYYKKIAASRPYVVAIFCDPRTKGTFDWAVKNKLIGDGKDEKAAKRS